MTTELNKERLDAAFEAYWEAEGGTYAGIEAAILSYNAPPRHMHVAGTTIGKHIDECAKCGRDLRDPIHAHPAGLARRILAKFEKAD